MCDIVNWAKNHKLFILFLGFLLILISVILLIFQKTDISPLFLMLGLALFGVSIVLFLYQKFAGKNSWKNLFYYVLGLAVLLWGVMSTQKIDSMVIRDIQNTYITIDIAIITVTFAAFAINSNNLIPLLKRVKKVRKPNEPPAFNIELFKNFILVTAFMILFSVFVSVFAALFPKIEPLFGVVYIPSFLFGMTTCLTIVLIFILMGNLFVLIDKILNPENYEDEDAGKAYA